MRPAEETVFHYYSFRLPPERIVGVCAGLAGHHLPHVPGGARGGGGWRDGSAGGGDGSPLMRGGDGRRGRGEASPGRAQLVLAVQALHLELGHLNTS